MVRLSYIIIWAKSKSIKNLKQPVVVLEGSRCWIFHRCLPPICGDNWNTFSKPWQCIWSALWWLMSFSVIVSNRCERAEWGFHWSVLWMSANCILLLPALAQESHTLVISTRHAKGREIYCLRKYCLLPLAQPDR